MKKQFKIAGISMLMLASVALSAVAQHEGNKKDKKDHKENHGKNKQMHDNSDKHDGKWDKKEDHDMQDEKWEKNKKHDGKGDKNEKHDMNDDENEGQNNDGRHGHNGQPVLVTNGSWDGFIWNRENFRQRMQIKNQKKVTICHHFNNSDQPNVNINVSANAVQAHLNHGDNLGACPTVKSQYSESYIRKRNEYYTRLQNAREQVAYSQSMLNYAKARLAESRLQLATMQRNNLPKETIERKQAVVVELENNTTLLGTLIGVAANVIVNKL